MLFFHKLNLAYYFATDKTPVFFSSMCELKNSSIALIINTNIFYSAAACLRASFTALIIPLLVTVAPLMVSTSGD